MVSSGRGLALLAGFVASAACGPPAPSPRGARVTVTTEPPADPGALPRVARFHVSNLGEAAPSLLLVKGDLSAYYAGKLRQGELPGALEERRVESIAWNHPGTNDTVLAPSVPLEDGETYTLAALGRGPLEEVIVSGGAQPLALRLWPPRKTLHAGVRSVFCALSRTRIEEGTVWLDPAGYDAAVLPGADGAGRTGDRCLHLEVEGPPPVGVAVPPPSLGDVALDPAPIVMDPDAPPTPAVDCPPAEVPLGPGCALVEDDRLVLRSPPSPLLWALYVGDRTALHAAASGARFALTGLVPGTELVVAGTATDVGGRETPFSRSVHLAPARPHVVLNEVLANPLGPEPASEWVELVNDGTIPVDLSGFTLSDGGGTVVLPRAVLEPGEYALVVSEAYVPTSADVPPAEGTLLVRVPRLGSSGLSNAGEALRLNAPNGDLVSSFPAVPAPKGGVSVARRAPSALDDDPGAFLETPSGGATPGADNHIVSPD